MEHLKLKLLQGTLFLSCVGYFAFQASAIDTKRFDAPPLERGEYLAFTKPITLRYGSTPAIVDRRKLIMPTDIKVVVTTVTVETKPSNVPDVANFPLLSYQDENSSSQSGPRVEIPENFPLAAPPATLPYLDPFEGQNSLDVDSTDELLEVFESTSMSPSRSRIQNIPFVPPYTIAPDSMRVTNKATYQRRQR
jgi:hypothetical protein